MLTYHYTELRKTGACLAYDPPIEGNVVDVVTGEVFPGRVFHEDGVVTAVERAPVKSRGYLVPGFIDAHIHIDSSLLCPSRFAEAVVPRGTTAVVSDPHEIANVSGIRGISDMRMDAAMSPLRVFFTAPSCVPATPYETSGAVIGPDEVAGLLAEKDVVALGEVMNYMDALGGSPDLAAKIGAAVRAGKPVDGHCPLLRGEGLRKYVRLGISTDHECIDAGEAAEKHALGMRIMVRQGSAAKNLEALAPFARGHDFLLVSDDMLASDLVEGHLDATLARAVSLGIDPMHALRAVTLRPAAHYRLPMGAIAPGRFADIARVSDLSSFEVAEVYIGGRRVALDGRPLFHPHPLAAGRPFPVSARSAEDFAVPASGTSVRARVIGVVRDQIVTESGSAVLGVENGRAGPDPGNDILLVAVVNRYRDAPASRGFVKGFGLSAGALASSVAHDSHNIIVVGADRGDMACAVNALIREGGGLCFCRGNGCGVLPLEFAGLMSTEPAGDVARTLERIRAMVREQGCTLDRPFMTMSFLSLLVIPRLKIGDRGLFDVDASRMVDPILPSAQ